MVDWFRPSSYFILADTLFVCAEFFWSSFSCLLSLLLVVETECLCREAGLTKLLLSCEFVYCLVWLGWYGPIAVCSL